MSDSEIELRSFNPVRPGHRLGLIAPASPSAPPKLAPGLSRVEELGFHLSRPDQSKGRFPYLAGPDRERAELLTELFLEPEIDGIFCIRGGYGSLRTAAFLDFDLLAEQDKPLVGFSDITVLLSGLLKAGLTSIHGPSVFSMAKESKASLERLKKILAGGWAETEPLSGRALSGRQPAEGRLVGGNLTLLSHLIGTPWQPPSAGAIIFIEEVGETLYRQDRFLTHLISAGFFSKCAGIALGRFDGDDYHKSEQLVAERLGGLNVPLVSGLPFGHQPDNLALLVGGPARLDPVSGTLIPLEG